MLHRMLLLQPLIRGEATMFLELFVILLYWFKANQTKFTPGGIIKLSSRNPGQWLTHVKEDRKIYFKKAVNKGDKRTSMNFIMKEQYIIKGVKQMVKSCFSSKER